jgi:AcrR family transcriptional regulator
MEYKQSQGASSKKAPRPARSQGATSEDEVNHRPEGDAAHKHPFVPPAPPKTTKAAATRGRILEAAAVLFIQRGYHASSMSDIAEAVELTKGAIYGHFRSKGQLLIEVIRWKLAEREHAPEFQQRLSRDSIGLLFEEEAREVRLLQVDAAAAARHDADVASGLRELYSEREERINDALKDAHDPEAVGWLISVLARGIAMKQAIGQPMPDPQRLHETLKASLSPFSRQSGQPSPKGRAKD